jgi:hypothetical protein
MSFCRVINIYIFFALNLKGNNMPLSCGCDYEPEPGQLFSRHAVDFEFLETSRRKRCSSCGELINIGSFVVRIDIFKVPEHEIEINIYGEDGEVPRAARYLCERCGEIYLNLVEVGFECIWVEDNMQELLKEYQEIYNPPKLKQITNSV